MRNHSLKMFKVIAISSFLLLALVKGDETIANNTVGDIVTVNVDVKADINNSIHQHYDNYAPSSLDVSNGKDIWDRIQELVGQLPLQPQPCPQLPVLPQPNPQLPLPEGDGPSVPVDVMPKPDNSKPWIHAERNQIVKQMYEFLSAKPEVWQDLQQLMKHLPKDNVNVA